MSFASALSGRQPSLRGHTVPKSLSPLKWTIALTCVIALVVAGFLIWLWQQNIQQAELDSQVARTLAAAGFTGRIESTLEKRLGRPLNRELAEAGRLLWFDTITGLNDDNTCGGCHSPTAA